ncbi:N-acetylmuramoyl-L-alanine amidase [Natranaerovirga pectinivora]|uniref:N-acetylmuramoyl-L-alanine amidase n=1 Tax=Natranaerovirga pectinivora TaxID=682400 RepID=A0A4R3MR00_9FIRM|nr:N-acetylmuramoyl-L-alanine amidase [Natranaerovirga pectinivora]TCT14998.1 N-acetylmuramoyl-L-alanine amidase [Natranaerovirga pectinivora]
MRKVKVLLNDENTNREANYLIDKGYTTIKLKDFLEIIGEEYFKVTELAKLFNLEVQGLGNAINIINEDPIKKIEIVDSNPNNGPLKGKKIVIDPGHGAGMNVSPVDKNYAEGDYVLKVSYELEKILIEEGAEVYVTRRDGTNITLLERGKMYSDNAPDLLISVHTNAIGNVSQTNVSGTEIIYSVKHPNDKVIAETMMKTIAEHLGVRTRRVFSRKLDSSTNERPIDWYGILRNSVTETTHSFIIEGAFHDNPNDLKILTEEDGHKKYAEAIKKAIVAFFTRGY